MSEHRIPYLISAGEPSGDLLGGDLAAALHEAWPEGEPFGIVGPQMLAQGVEGVTHIRELTVMGFAEVIKHLPRIKQIENQLLAEVVRRKPAFAVLVDYPGFHLHLAAKLKKMGVRVYMYVAPQMWAWGAHRVKRLQRVTDVVLGIMPFEKDFFVSRGINYHYVGTPQVDRAARVHAQRADFGLPEGVPVIGLFPGSRASEISRIVPLFAEILKGVRERIPAAHFVLSVAPGLSPHLFCGLLPEELLPASDFQQALATGRPLHQKAAGITYVQGSSLELMSLCDAACVTSGTATLECAMVQTPLCVIYRTSALTYAIGKRLVKLPHISLVNLVAASGLVREFVQEFASDDLAAELADLAREDSRRRAEVECGLRRLKEGLSGHPARGAASIIVAEL